MRKILICGVVLLAVSTLQAAVSISPDKTSVALNEEINVNLVFDSIYTQSLLFGMSKSDSERGSLSFPGPWDPIVFQSVLPIDTESFIGFVITFDPLFPPIDPLPPQAPLGFTYQALSNSGQVNLYLYSLDEGFAIVDLLSNAPITNTPEPATLLLLGLGSVLLTRRRARKA